MSWYFAILLAGGLAAAFYGHVVASWHKSGQCSPVFAEIRNTTACALLQQGLTEEALKYFEKALQIRPDYALAHGDYANALLRVRRVDEAINHYRRALELDPSSAQVHHNYGLALYQTGHRDEAMEQYSKAVELDPNYAEAQNDLGIVLMQSGRRSESLTHYERAAELRPTDLGTLNNLAWLLATSPEAELRNGQRAVELARKADEISQGRNAIVLNTLAAALAETGNFPEAISTAEKALQMASTQGNAPLANFLQQLLPLYRSGVPHHEPPSQSQ